MPAVMVAPTVSRSGMCLEIAPDVACLQLALVNVYFYGKPHAADRTWVLVDAGMAMSGGKIRRAVEERYGTARPAAIVLTHGHFDHVGSVAQLADLWDAPVYAHRLEMPYLTGRADYPPPDPTVGGGMIAAMSRVFSRRGIDLGQRVRELPADGTVPHMPGWRWIHVPGHAPGQVALFRDADRTVIAADAFVTVKQESALAVLTQTTEVRRPPAYFTIDWPSARKSVETLAALRPEAAGTGHGLPLTGDTLRRELDDLATHFDRQLPPEGRYVRQPVVADERGPVRVPPPVPDPQAVLATGAGLALLIGSSLIGSNSRS